MCREKSWVHSCAWIGLGLLVFIVLPLTVIGWKQGKPWHRGWSKRKQNPPSDETQQQRLRRMDHTLRETAESLERLSAEMRKETGAY